MRIVELQRQGNSCFVFVMPWNVCIWSEGQMAHLFAQRAKIIRHWHIQHGQPMPVDRNVIDNQMSRFENKTTQNGAKGVSSKASAESPFFKRASAEIRLKKLVSTDRSEIRFDRSSGGRSIWVG